MSREQAERLARELNTEDIVLMRKLAVDHKGGKS